MRTNTAPTVGAEHDGGMLLRRKAQRASYRLERKPKPWSPFCETTAEVELRLQPTLKKLEHPIRPALPEHEATQLLWVGMLSDCVLSHLSPPTLKQCSGQTRLGSTIDSGHSMPCAVSKLASKLRCAGQQVKCSSPHISPAGLFSKTSTPLCIRCIPHRHSNGITEAQL